MTIDLELARGLIVWTVSLGFLTAVVVRPPRWLGPARFSLLPLIAMAAWELAAMIASFWQLIHADERPRRSLVRRADARPSRSHGAPDLRPDAPRTMNDLLFLLLIWIALSLSFVAGCAWNSGAYQRGYEDGYRTGFNDALGRDVKR